MIEELENGQWVVGGDTHLGKWARERGNIITDPHLFRWLHARIDWVDVIWDVGANIGDHTRQYLDWGKQVVAVEPNPDSYACLVHNCPEAITLNIAASDKDETLPFMRLDNVGASRIGGDGETLVLAGPLDSLYSLPRPQFIKIDVEGWEVRALAGMRETITACKPMLYIEVNKGALEAAGTSQEELREVLGSLGYSSLSMYPPNATWSWPQFDIFATT